MRNWKNWLFPILTCLTVAALALLPLRLSLLQDGKLTGTIHAEPLAEDSNFPFKPPELPGRIWLLTQWQQMPEDLTIMSQYLETDSPEWRDALNLVQEALKDLETLADFAVPDGNIPTERFSAERVYLRDQTDLSSASFLDCSGCIYEGGGCPFYVTLDVETGRALSLDLIDKSAGLGKRSPAEAGGKFLDRLGLRWELAEEDGTSASFRLTEDRRISLFCFTAPNELMFQFEVDWSEVDNSQALNSAMGYDIAEDGG